MRRGLIHQLTLTMGAPSGDRYASASASADHLLTRRCVGDSPYVMNYQALGVYPASSLATKHFRCCRDFSGEFRNRFAGSLHLKRRTASSSVHTIKPHWRVHATGSQTLTIKCAYTSLQHLSGELLIEYRVPTAIQGKGIPALA